MRTFCSVWRHYVPSPYWDDLNGSFSFSSRETSCGWLASSIAETWWFALFSFLHYPNANLPGIACCSDVSEHPCVNTHRAPVRQHQDPEHCFVDALSTISALIFPERSKRVLKMFLISILQFFFLDRDPLAEGPRT